VIEVNEGQMPMVVLVEGVVVGCETLYGIISFVIIISFKLNF